MRDTNGSGSVQKGPFVRVKSAQELALILLLTAGVSGSALAVKPQIPPGHEPPQELQQAQPEPAQRKCVTQKETFSATKSFVIELANSCEHRMRCTVHAYIVNARGPTRGKATLTLEPGSQGQETRKSYIIKLQESYGEANTSYECNRV